MPAPGPLSPTKTTTIPTGEYRDAWPSPDGRRLVFERADPLTGKSDLWIRDLQRGTLSRFTFESIGDKTRVTIRWSPDKATDEERATFDRSHDSMRPRRS